VVTTAAVHTPAVHRPPFELSSAEVEALGRGDVIIRDRVLGGETALAVVAEAETLSDELRPAAMGRAGQYFDATVRGDEIRWLERAELGKATAALWRLLEEVRGAANAGAYLGLRRFDLQLARYLTPGARYGRHADAFQVKTRRRLTAIYYANPAWRPEHGGLLRAYAASGPCDIEPVLDRLVLFSSERVEHEVMATYVSRTALTAWYYDADGIL
jgi:SM-20-related protein